MWHRWADRARVGFVSRLTFYDSRRLQIRGRQEPRRAAVLRGLFVGVGDLDQRRLGPGAAEEGDADRQAELVAGRNRDVRISRDGWHGRAAVHAVIAVDEVDQRGWSARRRDESVEPVLVHRLVDSLLLREPQVLLERVAIGLFGERTLRLGLQENLLTKVGHFLLAVPFVEIDQVLELPRARSG